MFFFILSTIPPLSSVATGDPVPDASTSVPLLRLSLLNKAPLC